VADDDFDAAIQGVEKMHEAGDGKTVEAVIHQRGNLGPNDSDELGLVAQALLPALVSRAELVVHNQEWLRYRTSAAPTALDVLCFKLPSAFALGYLMARLRR
jgi:hypothetical protein